MKQLGQLQPEAFSENWVIFQINEESRSVGVYFLSRRETLRQLNTRIKMYNTVSVLKKFTNTFVTDLAHLTLNSVCLSVCFSLCLSRYVCMCVCVCVCIRWMDG